MNIFDSFANLLSGIGLGNPKTAANTYLASSMYGCSPEELEAAYRGSTWFGRIVEDRPTDATSEWRSWQAEAPQVTAIEAEETRLGVLHAVRKALIWARLYGGGAIYLGGLPGAPSSPLNIDRVGVGSLRYLTVYTRYEMTCGALIRDPLDPDVGKPEYYEVQGVRIHPSRVVVFRGRQVGTQRSGDGWGDSLWVQMRDAVTNADAASAILAALMQEAKSDIVSVSGLLNNMATDEYTTLMARRFQMAQTVKSVTGVTLLDKDDEWDTRQITWTGLPAVVETQLTIMCGAAGYPVTRLLGTSARGLNATGEGDLRNYYDSVRREQRVEISPAIARLDECLIRSALGSRPPEIWYTWSPLWMPTAKEQAETSRALAETDKIYVETGLVAEPALARAVTNRLIDSGVYPGLDEAVKEFGEPDFEVEPEPDLAADAAPRSLYVRRDVLNGSEILAWARSQGLKSLYAANELHVTIMYSRKAVDWLAMGQARSGDDNGHMTVPAGGPRVVERLGPKRVVVLSFANADLAWRHRDLRDRGAESDYDEYVAHVTLSDDSHELVDLDSIVPYRGKIELGPEIFEEVRD